MPSEEEGQEDRGRQDPAERALSVLCALCDACREQSNAPILHLEWLFGFHGERFVDFFVEQDLSRFESLHDRFSFIEGVFIEYVRDKFVFPVLSHQQIPRESLTAVDALPIPVAHLLLYMQRKLLLAILERDQYLYDALVCRKPSLGFSFSYLFEADGSVTSSAPEYYASLARSLERDLAEGTVEAAWQRFTGAICAIKSPARDFMEMGYFAEGKEVVGNGKRRGQAQRIADLNRKLIIERFSLRPEQHEPIVLSGGKSVSPSFSDSDVELLGVLHACAISRKFFTELPERLISQLEVSGTDPGLVGVIRLELLQSRPLRVLEFPSFQQTDMLALTYDNIRHTLLHGGPHAEEALKTIQKDYLQCVLMFSDLLQSESYISVWDLERYQALVPYLQRLKYFRPWDRKEITAEIRTCQSNMREARTASVKANDEIRSLLQLLSADHIGEEEFRRFFGDLHIPNPLERRLSEQLAELFGTVRLITPGEEDEGFARARLVVDVVIEAIKNNLDADLVRDPSHELDIIDPIPASVFDVPDHTAGPALHIKEVLRTNGFHAAKEDPAYHNYLYDVAAIALGMEEGKSKEELSERHPDALVQVVHVRDSLNSKSATPEALKDGQRDQSIIVDLVGERSKIDDYAKAHVDNIAQFYFSTLREVQVKVGNVHPLERMLVRAIIFEIVFDWYFLWIENVYNLEGRDYDTVPELDSKRLFFLAWLRHLVARSFENHSSELFLFLIMRRPAILYTAWELGDFNVENTRARAEYLRRLAVLFIEQSKNLSGSALAEYYLSFWFMVKAPYHDLYRNKLYPLNEYIDHVFSIEPRQSVAFTGEIRQALLNDWVDRNEYLFFFRFEELFLAELELRNPLLKNSLIGALLDETLAARKREVEEQAGRRPQVKQGEALHASELELEVAQLVTFRAMLDKDRDVLVRSAH